MASPIRAIGKIHAIIDGLESAPSTVVPIQTIMLSTPPIPDGGDITFSIGTKIMDLALQTSQLPDGPEGWNDAEGNSFLTYRIQGCQLLISQVRMVLLGHLWGMEECRCQRVVSTFPHDRCPYCNGLEKVPIIAPLEGHVIEEFGPSMPVRAYYDENGGTRVVTEHTPIGLSLEGRRPADIFAVWRMAAWFHETAREGIDSTGRSRDMVVADNAIDAIMTNLKARWLNPGANSTHLTGLYQECRKLTEGVSGIHPERILAWESSGVWEGFLDTPKGRRTVIALSRGEREQAGSWHVEDHPDTLRGILLAMENVMRAVEKLIREEHEALGRAEEGESIRSAMGKFEVGDEVLIRKVYWEQLKSGTGIPVKNPANAVAVTVPARLADNDRNRVGRVIAASQMNGGITVEHACGSIHEWSKPHLKLLADALIHEVPVEQPFDFSTNDEDAIRRLRRRFPDWKGP